MIWVVLTILGIVVLYVTETVPRLRRFARTWRAFRQFQQLLATPLGRAYVAGVRDNAASLQRGLDIATWDDQMTQGGSS